MELYGARWLHQEALIQMAGVAPCVYTREASYGKDQRAAASWVSLKKIWSLKVIYLFIYTGSNFFLSGIHMIKVY